MSDITLDLTEDEARLLYMVLGTAGGSGAVRELSSDIYYKLIELIGEERDHVWLYDDDEAILASSVEYRSQSSVNWVNHGKFSND